MLLLNKNIDSIPLNSFYIGRPSKWGNPFIIGRDGSRNHVIKLYREYLYTSGLINDIDELKDYDALVCWCSPLACHGDVLIEKLKTGKQ